MMGKPAKRYTDLAVGIVALVACWSACINLLQRDGNQLLLGVMAAGDELEEGEADGRGVKQMYKRVELVKREGSSVGVLSSLSAASADSGKFSQAERQSALEEMANRESGRIQFIQAKLHAPGIAHETASSRSSSTSGALSSPLYSGQIVNTANYVMAVGLGTPSSKLLMTIDTGSDLAWTQCLPCAACYSQRDAIFDPIASSSYKKIPCSSAQCAQLGGGSTDTCSRSSSCEYIIGYLDGSYTTGDLAMEALSVSGEVVAKTYPFGCGHDNEGLFTGFDGLLGLSRGALSFPAQTTAVFGGVFGYCMPPIFSSAAGYIEFGRAAAAAERGGATTPLVALSATPLYVVAMQAIQVKGKFITNNIKALVVVDSGTVITRLDRPLYTKLRDAFKQAAIASYGVKAAPQSAGMGLFDACFTATSRRNPATLFPPITFTFAGGSSFTLPAQNIVIPADNHGTYCLAFLPLDSSSGVSILGNLQQQSHLFTFDIPRSTLTISSHAC